MIAAVAAVAIAPVLTICGPDRRPLLVSTAHDGVPVVITLPMAPDCEPRESER